MTVKERLLRFIDFLDKASEEKMNPRKFEIAVGMSNGYINNIKSSISKQMLDKISKQYPQLNPSWVMLGEGEMLRTPITTEAEEVPITDLETLEITKKISGTEFAELPDGGQVMLMPMVEPYAYAGYLTGFADDQFIDDLPKHGITVEKRHFGIYRAFRVRGDSMDNDRKDAYCNGDIVAGRQIDKKYWYSKFHLHKFEDYVIVHQDGIVIKRIIAHDVEKGIITCHSLNPDKNSFPDYQLNLSEVHEIYNIVSFERKKG